MDTNFDRNTYLALKNSLNFHNYRYHVLDDPVISDGEFDRMLVQLREMEDHHPEWMTDDSPTQRSGAQPAEHFERVTHPVPVLSLANAFNPEDVKNWYARIRKIDERVGNSRFVLEPKIDGLTVILHYEKGIFIRGATRGNGEVGEDITQNIRTISSVPLRIPVSEEDIEVPENLVVRAEAYISLSDFERLNEEFMENGLKTYQNPRNTAAGSLRMLDSSVVATRPLRILAYAVMVGNPKKSQWETLQYLKALGFPVSQVTELCDGIDEVLEKTAKWERIRETLDYEIDGVVIKLDNLTLAQDLGYVGKDPRGAIALKFPAQVVSTTLKDIGVQVGRTGVLTPYAVLKAVEIGGVTVRQATLHNFDFIADKDIRIGDRVLVKRAGEVIPYIIGPIKDVRNGDEEEYIPPETCPSCGEPVEKVEGEVAWYCVNNACPAQIIRNIEHYVSRGAMDIVGLGIRIVEQLVEAGLVNDVADLYSLRKEDLLKLDGFADKKADNLLEAIQASKTMPLARLINALGIHGVGEVAAEELAAHYANLEALSQAPPETIEAIEGFGPNTAQAIESWFAVQRNRKIVEKLKLTGVWPQRVRQQRELPQPFLGKRFVVTGTLPTYSRSEIKDLIKLRGGKVSDSVSKNTDYLVAGDNAGSKLDKARGNGVTVISEAKLIEMAEREGIMDAITLKPGREKSVLRSHPWIFSGAIDKVIGDPQTGETIWVVDSHGNKLGSAAYSPHSSIRARLWSLDANQVIDADYLTNKMRIAIDYRKTTDILNSDNNSCRLIHGESDGIPGLIVDLYHDHLVVQFLSAGPEYWRKIIVDGLEQITSIDRIYERSDVEVRKLEGLNEREGRLRGDIDAKKIEILEHGYRFLVDIKGGQKTGFFLDQRANRAAIQSYTADKEVLNCFSYTGAFGVYALKAGAAHVTSIESSQDANQLAQENVEINDLPIEKTTVINGDVFHELRLMRDKAQSFDLIILDPPKFAPTAAQVRSASRGYKDINLLAFKLLSPGGVLVTFSCSGGISSSLFQKIVADAALDAGVDAQIIQFLSQGADHPVGLNFPEGAYLKGLICKAR